MCVIIPLSRLFTLIPLLETNEQFILRYIFSTYLFCTSNYFKTNEKNYSRS